MKWKKIFAWGVTSLVLAATLFVFCAQPKKSVPQQVNLFFKRVTPNMQTTVGSSISQKITMENKGPGTANSLKFAPLPTAFTITDDNCSNASLPADSICEFVLVFSPTEAVDDTLNLEMNYWDVALNSNKTARIAITYQGLISTTDANLDFSTSMIMLKAPINGHAEQTIQVMNKTIGKATDISLAGINAPISIPDHTNNCKDSLKEGAHCSFVVAFDPKQEADFGSQKIMLHYKTNGQFVQKSASIQYAINPSNCTTNATVPPTHHDSSVFSLSFNNETKDCVFQDTQIHMQFLAQYKSHPDDPEDGKILVLRRSAETKSGYPVYSVEFGTEGETIPAFKLSDLTNGSFYFDTKSKHFYGARFLISVGENDLKSVIVGADQKSYTQPDINPSHAPNDANTPFDIFEFGYDPTPDTGVYYVFNTSFVDKFSIPLWFRITAQPPKTGFASIVSPIGGIKLRDSNYGNLLSRNDILTMYSASMVGSSESKNLFSLDNLKAGTVQSGVPARVLSPADKKPLVSPNYFDQSFENFFGANSPYVKSVAYPFHFCTGDPGPSSVYTYPGCASENSTCSTVDYPGCVVAGNSCAGIPPVGYRDIGDCFKGYVDPAEKTFYFWHYQNDTKPMNECDGSVSYNGAQCQSIIHRNSINCVVLKFQMCRLQNAL